VRQGRDGVSERAHAKEGEGGGVGSGAPCGEKDGGRGGGSDRPVGHATDGANGRWGRVAVCPTWQRGSMGYGGGVRSE
jgi:hypothetical protein